MKKLYKPIIYLGVALTFAGLAYLAFLGWYNRHWSDDWCYNRDFKYYGFFKTVGFYFATGGEAIRGWSLDRYAMSVVVGIFNLGGVFGSQIIAAVTILLWFAALYWTMANFAKLNKWTIPNGALALFCGFLLYYVLYISPDRFQILYWRSGVIPYSYTLIFGLTALGLITAQALRAETSKPILFFVALTGLFGGAFSEIGSALTLSGATLLLAAAWLAKRQNAEWARRAFPAVLAAWLSFFAAFILLLVAPSNDMRYTTAQGAPNNLWLIPFLSLKSALFFISDSLTTLPVPHLVLAAAFFSLSALVHAETQSKMELQPALRFAGLVLAVSFLLIIAIQAPTLYLYKAPPDPRGQSLSRFVMTAAFALISWAAGGLAARRLSGRLILLPALILLLTYGYTARAVSITTRDYDGFVRRAQAWDERDALMRQAAAQGIKRLEVFVIDTREIGTKDIMRSQDMERWVKSCAASYYGFEAIKANGAR